MTLDFIQNNILFSIGILALLHRYPVKLDPDPRFDFAGKIINIFHIVWHIFILRIKCLVIKLGMCFLCTSGDFLISEIFLIMLVGWQYFQD